MKNSKKSAIVRLPEDTSINYLRWDASGREQPLKIQMPFQPLSLLNPNFKGCTAMKSIKMDGNQITARVSSHKS